MDKSTLDKICAQVDTFREEAIEIEKQLTAIPALGPENDGDGEQKKAKYIQSYLEKTLHCDSINFYNAPDKRVPDGFRPNIVATFNGKNQAKTLWIMSHIDVVPPGDMGKWDGDPWMVRVEDGKIYGRGTEDNQQGIVSSLLTAKAFRDAKIQPECNLGLIFVADEETGNQYGIEYLLENHKDLFRENDFILVPDSGNAEGTFVEVAEKSILWLKFKVQGKQTHASTPELGVNAFKAGANLIVKLNNLYMIYNASDPVFDPPTSTFEPTKKIANVPNVNTIPGEDIFYFDCRVLPNYDLEHVKRSVKKICEEIENRYHVKIEVSAEHELQAAPPTSPDAPVVKALQLSLSDLRGIETTPKGIGGGTVAAAFREAGFSVVVWATQDETLHGPNEYVRIENILNDAKVFAHIALQG